MGRPETSSSTRFLICLNVLLALLQNDLVGLGVEGTVLPGVWKTATLSQGRSNLAATTVNHLAIFAGGYVSLEPNAMVDIYDASTQTWTTTTLSVARQNLAAATVLDLAIFAGGDDYGVNFYNTVDMFNATSGVWSTATLSVRRSAVAGASVADIALFAGGSNGTGLSAVVDIFNATLGQWSTASLSVARQFVMAATVADVVLFAGGDNSPKPDSLEPVPYNTEDIFNVTSGQWSVATLSQGRTNLAATAADGVAFFGGGWNTTQTYFSTVDIYDAATGSWSVDTMSTQRSYLAATCLGNLAFFAGGNSQLVDYAVVDVYDASRGTWYTASLSQARACLGATSVQQYDVALFAGGEDSYANVVDLYFPPPSPSPSASPLIIVPVSQDVVAAFSQTAPIANLTLTSGSGVQLNASSIGSAFQTENTTNENATSFTYFSHLANATVQQAFSFSSASRQAKFVDTSFIIPAATIKWTIEINSSVGYPQGLLVAYGLAQLTQGQVSTTTSGSSWLSSSSDNVTTYYIALQGSSANSTLFATVQVLNSALVDGALSEISHSVNRSWLILQFPPFNQSLVYDPILGLGELLSGKSTSGDTNLGVIIGVSVGGSIAVVVVVGAIVGGLIAAAWARKRINNRTSINFDSSEHSEGHGDGAVEL